MLIPIFIAINQALMLQNRLVNHHKLLLHNTFYAAKYVTILFSATTILSAVFQPIK